MFNLICCDKYQIKVTSQKVLMHLFNHFHTALTDHIACKSYRYNFDTYHDAWWIRISITIHYNSIHMICPDISICNFHPKMPLLKVQSGLQFVGILENTWAWPDLSSCDCRSVSPHRTSSVTTMERTVCSMTRRSRSLWSSDRLINTLIELKWA